MVDETLDYARRAHILQVLLTEDDGHLGTGERQPIRCRNHSGHKSKFSHNLLQSRQSDGTRASMTQILISADTEKHKEKPFICLCCFGFNDNPVTGPVFVFSDREGAGCG